MAEQNTLGSLTEDLRTLGVAEGDGLFVHASMGAMGPIEGGAPTVVEALLAAVGRNGLIGMPGFSEDACFPSHLDRSRMTEDAIAAAEADVPGFDLEMSPTAGMGVIAEVFRTWPGTRRSDHPTVSVCLNGPDVEQYLTPHSLAWATGRDTPLGHLQARPGMKMLLLGVGWNRCSALHTAETLAETRRTKTRRFKTGPGDAEWIETPDVADDMDRLFPGVGAAYEETGAVTTGMVGQAQARLCPYGGLVNFAAAWIDQANRQSGDRH